jgi:hypothetical protein
MVRFSESPFKPSGAGARKDYRLVPGRSDALGAHPGSQNHFARSNGLGQCGSGVGIE